MLIITKASDKYSSRALFAEGFNFVITNWKMLLSKIKYFVGVIVLLNIYRLYTSSDTVAPEQMFGPVNMVTAVCYGLSVLILMFCIYGAVIEKKDYINKNILSIFSSRMFWKLWLMYILFSILLFMSSVFVGFLSGFLGTLLGSSIINIGLMVIGLLAIIILFIFKMQFCCPIYFETKKIQFVKAVKHSKGRTWLFAKMQFWIFILMILAVILQIVGLMYADTVPIIGFFLDLLVLAVTLIAYSILCYSLARIYQQKV